MIPTPLSLRCTHENVLNKSKLGCSGVNNINNLSISIIKSVDNIRIFHCFDVLYIFVLLVLISFVTPHSCRTQIY